MNRILIMLLISLFVTSFVGVPFISAGEPYAPLHKFTEKDFMSKYGKMGLPIKDAEMMGMWPPAKAADVPDKKAIAAPAYPEAVIVAIEGPFKHGRGQVMGLSTLELLSSDPYEKVVSYYKEKLPEWNQKEFQSSHYFAQSGEVENGARNMEVPHIGFMNLEGGILGKEKYTGMDPNAKTLIQVFFKRN